MGKSTQGHCCVLEGGTLSTSTPDILKFPRWKLFHDGEYLLVTSILQLNLCTSHAQHVTQYGPSKPDISSFHEPGTSFDGQFYTTLNHLASISMKGYLHWVGLWLCLLRTVLIKLIDWEDSVQEACIIP